MAGLFDANTQLQELLERQRTRNMEQQNQLAQLYGNAAGNRRQAASNTVGARIGAALGQGLAGGLFGESENIEQARQAVTAEQELQNQLGKVDFNDPSSLQQAGSLLTERGLPEAGMRLMQRSTEVAREKEQALAQRQAAVMDEEKRASLATLMVNPRDSQAAQTAVLAGADPEKVKELRGQSAKSMSKFGKMAQDLGFTPGTPEYQAKVQQLMLTDPSGIKIINQMGTPPDAFVEEFGKKEAARLSEQANDAETAATSLSALEESINLINNNEIISGFGGDFKLGLSKVLAETGLIGSDNVAATEAFFANQGNQVAQIIKQFGAGTGLSDADREYAQKIAGGEISLTRQSLAKLLNLQRKYLRKGVQNYNKKLQSIDSDAIRTFANPIDIPRVPVALPENPEEIAINPETGEEAYFVEGEWVNQFGEPVQ